MNRSHPLKALLLLVSAIALWSLPAVVRAAVPEPISPAVLLVIQKADADIADAEAKGILAMIEEEYVPEWLDDTLSIVVAPIDTKQHIVIQRENLTEETACFAYDKWVIQKKMDVVKGKIVEAVEQHDATKEIALGQVYTFLSTELESLTHGGLDPEVMEDNAWADAVATEPATGKNYDKLCFYNSDYAPPSIVVDQKIPDQANRYGCDAELLQRVSDALPDDAKAFKESVDAELHAMTLAQDVVINQEGAQQEFQQLLQSVDDFVAAVHEGEHASDSSSSEAASSSSSSNQSLLSQAQHATQAGCVGSVNDGIVLHALRGPFTLNPDDIRLTPLFLTLWTKADEKRPISEELSSAVAKQSFDFGEERGLMKTFTNKQAALSAATFAAGVDPILSIEDAFGDLRAAVSKLVHLGNSLKGGLRGFVRDFAYFLRRSCLDRPCNARLDAILKLVFSDSCFAYGNGKYKKATCANPQWKQCLEEAGLPITNGTEENCVDESPTE